MAAGAPLLRSPDPAFDQGTMSRYYLGLATTFHDPALAVVGPEGQVLFAEATERYLQYKRAFNCEPDSAPRMAKLLGALLPEDAEVVVATSWGEKYAGYLARLEGAGRFDLARVAALAADLGPGLSSGAFERAGLAALHRQQRQAGLGAVTGLEKAFGAARIAAVRRYRHHATHAANAVLSSGCEEAACLVVDGFGEAGAASLFRYAEGSLAEVPAQFGTVSPGFFYALLTELVGFDSMAGEEWKVMGLAPYGRPDPKLAQQVRSFYRRDDRGRLLRPSTEAAREAYRCLRAQRPVDDAAPGWPDLAYAAQEAFGEMMDTILGEARRLVPSDTLVLCGGCALNSSYNGKIARRFGYGSVHVPSAPGDDGNAVGAALLAWLEDHPGGRPDLGPTPLNPYLGSTVDTAPLEQLRGHEPRLRRVGEGVADEAAQLLAGGKVVGWVQGRAEFGPRALGNRSILADPRPADAKDRLNAKVKYREAFRPFAPSILAEHGPDWFDDFQPSPYMERTLAWRPQVRARVPAVVHVDGTGRLQTVTQQANPLFHRLIAAFERLSGVPILLNTSLNVMGKPIAHTTEDALTLFYTTGLDALVVHDWLLVKEAP
jgi:carbamoyltransferase